MRFYMFVAVYCPSFPNVIRTRKRFQRINFSDMFNRAYVAQNFLQRSVCLFPRHRSEVEQAVSSALSLYARWKDLFNNPATFGNSDYDWTNEELKNSVKSIEWDLEDLGMQNNEKNIAARQL